MAFLAAYDRLGPSASEMSAPRQPSALAEISRRQVPCSPARWRRWAQEQRLPDPSVWAPRMLDKLITSPSEALSVFDFEPVMKEKRAAGPFRLHDDGHPATRWTLRANREGLPEVSVCCRAA